MKVYLIRNLDGEGKEDLGSIFKKNEDLKRTEDLLLIIIWISILIRMEGCRRFWYEGT